MPRRLRPAFRLAFRKLDECFRNIPGIILDEFHYGDYNIQYEFSSEPRLIRLMKSLDSGLRKVFLVTEEALCFTITAMVFANESTATCSESGV